MEVGKRAKKSEGRRTEEAFTPNVYDILAPEGLDQIKILGNYDKDEKKKVVIPLISLKSIQTDEGIKGLKNPLGVD